MIKSHVHDQRGLLISSGGSLLESRGGSILKSVKAWRAALPLQARLPVSWKRAAETIRNALVHGRTEAPSPTWA
jgi:hypothetical protein